MAAQPGDFWWKRVKMIFTLFGRNSLTQPCSQISQYQRTLLQVCGLRVGFLETLVLCAAFGTPGCRGLLVTQWHSASFSTVLLGLQGVGYG
jgi:hypothetical protein